MNLKLPATCSVTYIKYGFYFTKQVMEYFLKHECETTKSKKKHSRAVKFFSFFNKKKYML